MLPFIIGAVLNEFSDNDNTLFENFTATGLVCKSGQVNLTENWILA